MDCGGRQCHEILQKKKKTKSKSVIEMNKFLITNEKDESGDALSQLVREVDESVHSSSCEECEDGEFDTH